MDAMGLFGLALLAFSGRGAAPPARRSSPPARQLPPAPPAWPGVVPDDLPPFPGPGWVYDEPPPVAVKQRAAQLVAPLWRQGKGASRAELTAGRWITYRAEIVRSGKQGVVAYRVKDSSTLQRPPDERTSSPSSAPWTLPLILTSTSAGWPQAAPGGRVVNVKAGQWYQWSARVDVPPGVALDGRAFAEGIAKGLSAAGAVNIAVSDSAPFVLAYQLKAVQNITVPLGVKIGFEVLGVKASITFLDAKPIQPPKAPKVPIDEKPPGWVDAQAPAGVSPVDTRIDVPGGTIYAKPERSPLEMRELRVGDKGPDVIVLQQKLGAPADGVFGPQTQTKVIEFQRANGLAPNLPTEQLRARGFGAVKQATWVKLFGVRA